MRQGKRRSLDLERVKQALGTLLPEAAGDGNLHEWCRSLFAPRSDLRFVLAGAARGLIEPGQAQLWAIERLLLYGFGRPRTLIEVRSPDGSMRRTNVLNIIGANPNALAAAIALQRILEAGTGERRGEAIEGELVENSPPGLPERADSRDVAETATAHSQDAAQTRQVGDR